MTTSFHALGFHLLFQRDTEPGFTTIFQTMYNMFSITVNGSFDPDVYLDSNVPNATIWAFVVYVIVSTILMLNIFIAMINTSYSRIIADRTNQTVFAVSLSLSLPPPMTTTELKDMCFLLGAVECLHVPVLGEETPSFPLFL